MNRNLSANNELFSRIPKAPDFRLDWDGLDAAFDWIRAFKDCPQDPHYHAEGDVWIHTRMVCEALLANHAWRALPEEARAIAFLAALMHDLGKPACTREEDGRITSRGHSARGAIAARELLWRMNVPIVTREQVVNLIRWHQVPFFLVDTADNERRLLQLSQTTRCDWLALVTEADARGRVCRDQQRLLDNIALFAQFAAEHRCLGGPRSFPSDHSRFLYFRRDARDPDYLAFDDTACEVIVMAGFPGVGKDTWIARHYPALPVVSLDALRAELGVKPTDRQGAVIAAARERAREHLRRRQSFVWNATNISRQMREHCLSLCAAYNARLRIVYLETSPAKLFAQNEARADSVPAAVIERLFARWEVPDLTEAHRVDWIVS